MKPRIRKQRVARPSRDESSPEYCKANRMETRSVRPGGAKIALEVVQVLEFVLEDAHGATRIRVLDVNFPGVFVVHGSFSFEGFFLLFRCSFIVVRFLVGVNICVLQRPRNLAVDPMPGVPKSCANWNKRKQPHENTGKQWNMENILQRKTGSSPLAARET